MRKLIGLISCFAIGFAFYQLLQKSHRENRTAATGRAWEPAPRPGVGTMTGPGDGRRVRTEDSDGAAIPHTVGRGVI